MMLITVISSVDKTGGIVVVFSSVDMKSVKSVMVELLMGDAAFMGDAALVVAILAFLYRQHCPRPTVNVVNCPTFRSKRGETVTGVFDHSIDRLLFYAHWAL